MFTCELNAFYSRSEFWMFSLISGRHFGSPLHGAPTWRFHTVLSKFEWNILKNNLNTEYGTNPRLQ